MSPSGTWQRSSCPSWADCRGPVISGRRTSCSTRTALLSTPSGSSSPSCRQRTNLPPRSAHTAWTCCAGGGFCGLSTSSGTGQRVLMHGTSSGGCRSRTSPSACTGDTGRQATPRRRCRSRGRRARRSPVRRTPSRARSHPARSTPRGRARTAKPCSARSTTSTRTRAPGQSSTRFRSTARVAAAARTPTTRHLPGGRHRSPPRVHRPPSITSSQRGIPDPDERGVGRLPRPLRETEGVHRYLRTRLRDPMHS